MRRDTGEQPGEEAHRNPRRVPSAGTSVLAELGCTTFPEAAGPHTFGIFIEILSLRLD